MISKYGWLAGMALLAGVALSVYLNSGTVDKEATASGLPQVELPDLDGTPQSLRQWQGKLLLVNFWATWCPPCREEIPVFLSLRKQHLAKGFEVVGISVDSVRKVAAFRDEMAIDYPLLNGEKNGMSLMAGLGNPSGALPYSILYDRSGRAVHFKTGGFSQQELAELIGNYL